MIGRGFVVAAARSGSGKTILTLALIRAFVRRGVRVASAKVGPDFIDPRYHEAASGRACVNLDGWAMRPDLIAALAGDLARDGELVVVEGVMGLFDAAEEPGIGSGSTAEMAKALGLPVVLVVDASGMGQSAAAVAQGLIGHDPDLRVAGLILNNVASERHRRILTAALEKTGLRVFGAVPRKEGLTRPSRHLGLVQAEETRELERFLEDAADVVAAHVDLDALSASSEGRLLPPHPKALERMRGAGPDATEFHQANSPPLPLLGQRIALASDIAFRFVYPHVLDGWRRAGVELLLFSPLADESPDSSADAVYLPGGYPELHAGRLASADRFRVGMQDAARRGATIYGECGGYMVLGRGLIDSEGRRHAMLGLLPVETSFANRKLHLGYRHVALARKGVLGSAGAAFRAHEFHYSTALKEDGDPLFLPRFGVREGRIMGSYLHLIDHCSEDARQPISPAIPPKVFRHGGDLHAAERLYGRPKRGWLDLSTGINPHSYPVPPLPTSVWTRLPESGALAALLDAARTYYGCSGAIMAAPGAQAILHALSGLLSGRRAAFVAPAYGGYAEAWAGSGVRLAAVAEPDPDAADVLILGQPNNPDGRVRDVEDLLTLADRLARRGGLLIADESFADAVPEASLAAWTGRPGLLILRSFGKFFGLAGLRLGFALGEPDLIARLTARLGPWAVSGPASSIATAALSDRAWIESMRRDLPAMAARLDALLIKYGFRVAGGTPLFRLAEHPAAFEGHERLARSGVWTRRFDGSPTRLRFGPPGREEDWTRLEEAMTALEKD